MRGKNDFLSPLSHWDSQTGVHSVENEPSQQIHELLLLMENEPS